MKKRKVFLLSSVKSLVYVCHFRERHRSSGDYLISLPSRNKEIFVIKDVSFVAPKHSGRDVCVCLFGSRDS